MTTWSLLLGAALSVAGFEEAVRSAAERHEVDGASLRVFVRDLETGAEFGLRADEPTYLASCVKVGILVEVYRQRQMGRLALDEVVEYLEEDVRDGAPRLNRRSVGDRIALSTLVDWMVRSSDNGASDLILRRVGRANVEAGLRALGIQRFGPVSFMIDVRRGVYGMLDPAARDLSPSAVRTIRWTDIWRPQLDRLAAELGRSPGTFRKADVIQAYDRFYAAGMNSAPMRTMAEIFTRLARHELVSVDADRQMLDLLSHPRTSKKRIRGRLPPGVRVAHKTGSQFRRMCDMGAIQMPRGAPLVIAACMVDAEVDQAERAIADVSAAAYTVALRQRSATTVARKGG